MDWWHLERRGRKSTTRRKTLGAFGEAAVNMEGPVMAHRSRQADLVAWGLEMVQRDLISRTLKITIVLSVARSLIPQIPLEPESFRQPAVRCEASKQVPLIKKTYICLMC
jgi:hypothetical protein